MRLAYEAFDDGGNAVRGIVEAGSRDDATLKLREQGLFVSTLREAELAATGSRVQLPSVNRLKGLSLIARQLALLISTGTPVVDSLKTIERQVKDEKWRDALAGIRSSVEDGTPLSEAMADYPRLFDPVARSLLHAGEMGGNLEDMLRRLAKLARQQEKLAATIMGSMLYPAVLIVVSVAVLILMLTFVLPKFTTMFDALDAPLPASTQFLLGISDLLRNYWWSVPPAVALIGFGLWQLFTTRAGRLRVEWVLLNGPMIGKIARALMVARLVRLLGVLLDAKVPLIEALKLTQESVPTHHFKQLMARAETSVAQGEPLSQVFDQDAFVPSSVSESIANGERTGRLGNVLSSLADFMDEDNELIVRSLSSIIEPVILVLLGILVGFVAISMFLPLFDLSTITQPGAH